MFAVAMPSDSRKTPPHGYKRPQSQPGSVRDNEARDAEGFAARREREAREREAAPEMFGPREDLTDRYEGEQLAALRAERPLGERIAILEVKSDGTREQFAAMNLSINNTRLEAQAARVKADEVLTRVGGVEAAVAGLSGEMKGQNKVLETIAADVKRNADREHVSVMRKVELDKAGQLAQVDIQRAEALADVDVERERELAEIKKQREEELDAIKRRRDRRKLWLAIVGLLGSGAGLIKLIELIVRHL